MKKTECYEACQKTYDAFVKSIDEDSKSHERIDYWLREFLQDSSDDDEWLCGALYLIGLDNMILKKWFFDQVKHQELWPKQTYGLITIIAYSLTSNH